MGRCRFVDPGETKRYELSDGDSVVLKKWLNAADQKKLEGAGVPSMRREEDGPKFDLDYAHLGLARLEVYIVSWSFADAKGQPTKPDFATIATLDTDTIKEIDAVLDAHIPAMEKEKNDRRQASAGVTS